MVKITAFLQPGMADWEAGPVLALMREELSAAVTIATPHGAPVTSIGGLTVSADLSYGQVLPEGADLFLLIGSEEWSTFSDEGFFRLLHDAVEHEQRIVGAICAGTVAAARAGLFKGRAHTSNSRAFLNHHAPDYAGSAGYRDTPAAVSDDRVVSAPGSAPITFAAALARLAAPDQEAPIREYEKLFAREFSAEAATTAAGAAS